MALKLMKSGNKVLFGKLRLTPSRIGVICLGFAIVGAVALRALFALSGEVVAFEAEAGAVSGNSSVRQDSLASNGSYVVMGGPVASPTPTPPTPPPVTPPSTSGAITYGTDGNGNPSLTGCTVTVESTQSIQAAINSAASGAVLCVKASSRSGETVTINKTNMTIRATGKVTVRNIVASSGGVTVDGFTVAGGSFLNPQAGIESQASNVKILNNLVNGREIAMGISCDDVGCTNLLVSGNTVTNIQSYGVYLHGGNAAEIRFNNIYDLYKSYANGYDVDGMRFFGTTHHIHHNYIHDINVRKSPDVPHVDCFQNYQQSGIVTQNVLIENNYCTRISAQCLIASNGAWATYDAKAITFRSNVCEVYDHQAINFQGLSDSVIEDNLLVSGYMAQVIAFSAGFNNLPNVNHIVRRNIILRASTGSIVYYQNDTAGSLIASNIDKIMTSLAPRKEAFLSNTGAYPARTNSDFTEWRALIPTLGNLSFPLGNGAVLDVDGKTRPIGTVREIGPYEL